MRISKSHWTLILGALFLTTSLIYFDIAWNETIYRLGMLSFPFVYGASLLVFLTARFAFKRGSRTSLNAALILPSALFAITSISHRIDKYKPTLTLTIPEEVVGCVYIFQTEDSLVKDTTATPYGIAYIPYGGHYHLRIEHRGKDISSRLGAGSSNEIQFFNEDSTRIRWTSLSCINITEDSNFTKVGWSWVHYVCMDDEEFEMYVGEDLIDTTGLKFKSYTYTEQDLKNRK